MTMSGEMRAVARRILETVPLVMRTLASEVRLTGHSLAPVHLQLLLILAHRSHNLSELAEKQAVSLPTMSNSISALVDRGWVDRARAPHDRRMVLIELTPAGRAVLIDIRDKVETRLTELFAALSPDECEQLSTGLELLSRVLSLDGQHAEQPGDRFRSVPAEAEINEATLAQPNGGRDR